MANNKYLDLIPNTDNVVALPRGQAGALGNAEQAGKANKVSQETGVPASVVSADFDAFQQQEKGRKAAAAINSNPYIAGYVARNETAAEVSNDDYDQLGNLSVSISTLDPHRAMFDAVSKGVQQGFGDQPVGFSLENRLKYPAMYLTWQPFVAPLDTLFRLPGAVIGGGASGLAELYRKAGGDEASANKLDRDLRVLGMGTLIESGMRPQGIQPSRGPVTPGVRDVTVDEFFSALRGMRDRKAIDEFLAKKDGTPTDVLRIEFQKERVAADSAKMDEAVQAAAETNTKARAPALLEDFIRGHETDTISLPAKTLATIYQEAGKVPARGDGLFGFVPNLDRKLPLAADTGVEIDIPVSAYLAHIDPAVHEKVKENIRFTNDGVTLAEAKELKPEVIEAYHGSPYTFDAFSMEKVGTGEGAQSYGHGLYFAERPEVARDYKERLESRADVEAAIAGEVSPPGSLYKVSISANRERFLDWDKPLIEQGEIGARAFKALFGEELKPATIPSGAPTAATAIKGAEKIHGEEKVSQLLSEAGIPGIKYLDQGSRNKPVRFDPESKLWRVEDRVNGELVERDFKTEKEARNFAGPETRNFVIFDPKIVTILERNGQRLRDETLAQESALGLKPLFAEPLPNMTKADFERYNKKIAQVQERALEKATALEAHEVAKRKTAEWKANEAALRPEVEAEVRAFPDIAADRFLRTGEMPDGSKAAKVRLDEDYVKALLDKNEIPAIMLEKNSVHPDDIAPLFGYQNGSELVRGLNDLQVARRAAKESPSQHVARLVKDELAYQMELKHGNLEVAITDEARSLALSDLHFDILVDELRALAQEAGAETPLTKDALKAWVKEQFAQANVKEAANFAKYQKTAGREGLMAERALLKGDPIEAFAAKQRQVLSFLLAKESAAFSKTLDRTAKKIDRVTSAKEISSMDQEHFDQLRKVLGELGFDVKHPVPENMKPLGDFVTESDGQLAVAAWLTDGTLLPRDPGALTVQQMIELGKSIDSMMHVGRATKTLNSVHGRAELDNVVFDIVKQLERFDFINQPQHPSKYQMVKKGLKYVRAWNLLVERMLDYTDKFDPNGPITSYLDRPLRDSFSREIELNEKVTKKLRELSKLTDTSINDYIPNNLIPTKRLESGFLDMTRNNLRQLMGYMGSESGIEKVTRGFGVEAIDVWKLINDNATKADWQWVAGMHELHEMLWKESAEMQARVTGVVADAIEPRVMKSEKFGNFSGGYWPVKYDLFDSNIAGDLAMKGKLFEPSYIQAVTPHAYTLPRTKYAGALDLTGTFGGSHIKGIIHDIAFREAVLNANKLISNKPFMTAMRQRWGEEYSGLLQGWLRDIANAQKVDDSYAQGVVRILSLVRQNIVSTLIAWNPGTFIKHGGTALGMSVASVGAKEFAGSAYDFGLRGMLGAAKEIVAGQKEAIKLPEEILDAVKAVTDATEYGDGVRQFILDSSPLMRNRQRQAMDNVREAYQANIRSGGKQLFMDLRGVMLDVGRVPIAASDALSAFPTWLSAYRESMTRTGDHAQAVFEADRQMARSHGSNFIGDKPLSLRVGGNTLGGELVRMITPLYNFFNHNFNIALQWAWDAGARWKGADEPGANIKGLSNTAFWAFIMAVVMEELAAPALDEHKQGIATRAFLATVRHTGAWIPGLRDFTNAVAGGYEPSVGFLGTIYKNIYQTAKDMNKASKDWITHVVTSIGFATGMLGSQYGRVATYLKERMVGRERTPVPPQTLRQFNELRQGFRTGHSKPRIH